MFYYIKIIDEKCEDVKNVVGGNFNIAEYTKKVFSMYKGKTETVTFLCDESVLSVVIDRFGDRIHIRKHDGNNYSVTVKADISPTFFSWVFMLGNNVKLISPENVVEEYKKSLKENIENY